MLQSKGRHCEDVSLESHLPSLFDTTPSFQERLCKVYHDTMHSLKMCLHCLTNRAFFTIHMFIIGAEQWGSGCNSVPVPLLSKKQVPKRLLRLDSIISTNSFAIQTQNLFQFTFCPVPANDVGKKIKIRLLFFLIESTFSSNTFCKKYKSVFEMPHPLIKY